MADELGAELSLDLDAARREIESFRRDVEDELDRAVKTFADSYEDTIGRLPAIEPEIESQVVTEELNRAITSVDERLEVETDGAAVTADLNEAVLATEAVVVPEVNTEEMTASLIDAVESTHPVLTPELDIAAVQSSLDDLAASASVGSDIGGGFSEADLRAQELDDSLADLNETGGRAFDTFGALGGVSEAAGAAFQAAKGDGQGLLSTLSRLSPQMKAVAGGALGVSTGFVALFAAGRGGVAAMERLETVLGDAAAAIEKIDVGGLTGELSDLAVDAGVSGSALRNAAASAAQMGLSSGASTREVTDFAEKVNALALRAVAMNPALGEAGSVAERLNLVLGRGGRFLARYGLALTSAEITTRALADSGKTAVRDLDLFERSVAGANIAVERLGQQLGGDFAKGIETDTVRLKSLGAELRSAFGRAGKDLVAPTIDGLEALATAGAGISKILGEIGGAVLPPVAAGFEAVGESVQLVTDVLDELDPRILAAGVAVLLLHGRVTDFVQGLREARTVGRATSLLDAIGGADELRETGSRLDSLKGKAADFMGTIGGRSIVALGSVVALDQGLKALGTSTDELGIQFITTGAAIGASIGGLPGLLAGAGIGAIATAITATSDLERATEEVDESFRKAETSSGDLRAALFAQASTSEDLAAALASVDSNLSNFVRDASAFKALGVADDVERLGLSFAKVAELAQQGEVGLARFFTLTRGEGVTIDFGKEIAGDIDLVGNELRTVTGVLDDTDAAIARNNKLTSEQKQQALFLKNELRELGVETEVTGKEFTTLTQAQQRQVLVAARAQGINTDLLVAFRSLQKQIRAAGEAQFEMFAQTNKLSPAIVDAARHLSKAEDGTTDWTKALRILGDAAVGILPQFGRLTAQTALLQREVTGIVAAADAAASSIPSLGSALSDALGSSFLEAGETLSGEPFLDAEKLIGNVQSATADFSTFFTNIQRIADTGAGNVSTALLQLGPSNMGARVAAELAANEPLFREGLERALEGLSKAQLVSESALGTLKARASFIGQTLGTPLAERLQETFNTVDLSQIPLSDLIGFIRTFGAEELGPAAVELVNTFNTEIAARKIAGLDTAPLEQSVTDAKGRIVAAATSADIDVAMQEAMVQATDNARARGEATTTEYAKGIDSQNPEVRRAADALAAIVEGGLFGIPGEANYFGGLTSEQLAEGMKSENPRVRAAAAAYQGLVESGMFGLPGAMRDIGIAAADGFIAGLGMKQSEVEAYIRSLSEADARLFGAGLQVGSPSKITTYYGEMLGLGLIRGMQNTERAVFSATQSLAAVAASPPSPPVSVQPIVRVALDPARMGQSWDQSISVGAINNYGPDRDTRGNGMLRAFRHLQFTGG